MEQVHNKAWKQLDHKEQKQKVEKVAYFKKTINFKVMKTIRNQLKYPFG